MTQVCRPTPQVRFMHTSGRYSQTCVSHGTTLNSVAFFPLVLHQNEVGGHRGAGVPPDLPVILLVVS